MSMFSTKTATKVAAAAATTAGSSQAVLPAAGALAMTKKGIETIGKVAIGAEQPDKGLGKLAVPPASLYKPNA